MLKKISIFLFASLLSGSAMAATETEVSGLAEFGGSATTSDFVTVYDASQAQGSRWRNIMFPASSTQFMNGLGVWTNLATSAAWATILSDETGSGSVVFNVAPNLQGQVTWSGTAVNDDDCTGDQGKMWWDSTDSAFEFCNANTGTPLTIGSGSGTVDTTGTINADEITVFSDSDTLKALTGAEFKTAYDLEAGTDFYAISAADAAFSPIAGSTNITTLGTILTGEWAAGFINAPYVNIHGATLETTIATDDEILIYDTSATANRRITRGNFVTGIGAGQAVTFDIGDDGGNDSVDVGEIATSGDTNSIFTEPSADKILIDLSNNWPGADLATTATTANAGDSATAFFNAGTIEHEHGGLEADVSAYTGLLGVTAGATTEVDTAAELETYAGLGAFANEYLDDANAAAVRTTLGLVIGTDVLAPDGDGTSLSGVATLDSPTFTTAVSLPETTMTGDLNLNANEIQSTGNVVFQLGDAAGTNKISVQDSGGTEVWSIDSDGAFGSVATTNPSLQFDQVTATDFWIGAYDTVTDRAELRTSATAGTGVLAYWDANKFDYAGNVNISTGHTYQINDTQIALADLSDGESHGANHILSGADEIDGDLIDIDYAESNYTPATTGVATNINHLAAHLEGIDAALGASGTGTIAGMTDSNISTPAAGHILVYDGTDSWDNKITSGDVILAADGSATIQANAVENSMMADNSVDSAEYVDGSIDTAHIAADQITSALIADDQIDSEHYAAGSIDTAHVAADQVTAALIADDQIDSEHYVAASIDNEHLADDAVGTDELSNTLNIVTTGTIQGAINIVTTTDGTESPTTAQMYGTFFIADHATATSDTDYTLPSAAAGMAACFYDNGAGAGGIIIDAATGDNILLEGTALAGTGYALDSPGVAGDGANGDFVCFLGIDADTWITLGMSGTWVDGGAD